MKTAFLVVAALLASFLFVDAAEAQTYTVVLKSGDTFDSRYPPQIAPWDESKVLLLTDVGNSISLARDDIDDVTVDTEMAGFGIMIDPTTILIGIAPNDALTPEELAALEAQRPFDPFAGLPEPVDTTMPMFREPGEFGGGIPAGLVGRGGAGPLQPGQPLQQPQPQPQQPPQQ